MAVTHAKVSAKADSADTSLVLPSDWNANHTISGQLNRIKGADLASAATVNLAAATGNTVHITGTTTITALGTVAAGAEFTLIFDGALTLTHNATSLILQGATNLTTAAGDVLAFVSEGSGNWRELSRRLAAAASGINGSSGGALAKFTNSLGADVTMTNANQFYDGPSTAQGTTGVFLATGTVTVVQGAAGPIQITAKLWDGTTVIATTQITATLNTAGGNVSFPLSGYITNPAANIKISVASNGTTETIKAATPNNPAGNTASTLSVVRIG